MQLEKHNIHVSCCLFSHKKNKKNKIKPQGCSKALNTWFDFENNKSLKTIKEKKRSTHACTHNCAARRAKYSRRLLSILAQQNTKKTNKTRVGIASGTKIVLLGSSRVTFFKKMIFKIKKNGAHTHVCTTVQLVNLNIHVGCCLFSHLYKQKK